MQNIKVKCRYYVQIIFLAYDEELILCNCKINANIRQKYETVLDLSAFVLMIFYSSTHLGNMAFAPHENA